MHRAVLLQESVANLVTSVDGRYVDGTFGRGGHSQLILDSLGTNGRLLGVDKDLEAKAVADNLVSEDPRFKFFHGSFAQLPSQLSELGMPTVDGILTYEGSLTCDAALGIIGPVTGEESITFNPATASNKCSNFNTPYEYKS